LLRNSIEEKIYQVKSGVELHISTSAWLKEAIRENLQRSATTTAAAAVVVAVT
jgi:hypothetical protein